MKNNSSFSNTNSGMNGGQNTSMNQENDMVEPNRRNYEDNLSRGQDHSQQDINNGQDNRSKDF